jgi:hypothetical protein
MELDQRRGGVVAFGDPNRPQAATGYRSYAGKAVFAGARIGAWDDRPDAADALPVRRAAGELRCSEALVRQLSTGTRMEVGAS